MKRDTLQRNQSFLLYQRNILASLAFILSIGVVALTALLFTKQERILVCPPVIEKSFWVENRAVDPTYLEQFGAFLGQLLLGKSTASSPSQRDDLLRHTDPAFVGALRRKLIEEEALLNKQNASYVFYPKSIQANATSLEVTIEGDRIFFVAGNKVSQTPEAYVLSFHYNGGRLLLKGIKAGEVEDA